DGPVAERTRHERVEPPAHAALLAGGCARCVADPVRRHRAYSRARWVLWPRWLPGADRHAGAGEDPARRAGPQACRAAVVGIGAADRCRIRPIFSRGMPMSTVLVTGGSGFIASYCILSLLAAGHQVRTTVRSLKREGEVRALLKEPRERLTFFAADLEQDVGWSHAVAGCEYVLHVASPFPAGVPRHQNELIVPAREGALRVLRAARDAGVRRVVMTSSFAAVGYGHLPRSQPFDETDWTDA